MSYVEPCEITVALDAPGIPEYRERPSRIIPYHTISYRLSRFTWMTVLKSRIATDITDRPGGPKVRVRDIKLLGMDRVELRCVGRQLTDVLTDQLGQIHPEPLMGGEPHALIMACVSSPT